MVNISIIFSGVTQTNYIDIYFNIWKYEIAQDLLSFDKSDLSIPSYTFPYNFSYIYLLLISPPAVEWGSIVIWDFRSLFDWPPARLSPVGILFQQPSKTINTIGLKKPTNQPNMKVSTRVIIVANYKKILLVCK